MNRQAITFLSLFSLILVLSVYYIMIPPVNYEDETNLQEVSLNDVLEQKRANDTQVQNDVLSSSQSSSEQISHALDSLTENKKVTSIEQKVEEALKKLGYTSSFCEVNENVIKVTIKKNNATKEDALKIMECVIDISEQKYSPEIKFISE